MDTSINTQQHWGRVNWDYFFREPLKLLDVKVFGEPQESCLTRDWPPTETDLLRLWCWTFWGSPMLDLCLGNIPIRVRSNKRRGGLRLQFSTEVKNEYTIIFGMERRLQNSPSLLKKLPIKKLSEKNWFLLDLTRNLGNINWF